MSDNATEVPQQDPIPDGCQLKDGSVQFYGMDPRILGFLAALGPRWKVAFGAELVITSARDGTHAEGGGHCKGMAVDIRSWGLAPLDRLQAAELILSLADTFLLRLYDESRLPMAAHFHVDTVG